MNLPYTSIVHGLGPVINYVVVEVANATKIKPEQIVQYNRFGRLPLVRQVCYWLVRKSTHAGLVEIGRAFHRNHASIINGLKKIERLRAEDRSFRDFTDALLRVVTENVGKGRPDMPVDAIQFLDGNEASEVMMSRFKEALKAVSRLNPRAAEGICGKVHSWPTVDMRRGLILAMWENGWRRGQIAKVFGMQRNGVASAIKHSRARIDVPGYELLRDSYRAAMEAFMKPARNPGAS